MFGDGDQWHSLGETTTYLSLFTPKDTSHHQMALNFQHKGVLIFLSVMVAVPPPPLMPWSLLLPLPSPFTIKAYIEVLINSLVASFTVALSSIIIIIMAQSCTDSPPQPRPSFVTFAFTRYPFNTKVAYCACLAAGVSAWYNMQLYM